MIQSRRKPEWMLMYQELIDLHRVHQEGHYPHRVTFTSFDDDDDMLEWCLEHLEMESWSHGWYLQGDYQDEHRVYSFREPEACALFSLTWA